MFEASEIIFGILNTWQPLLDLGITIQPIISDDKTEYPFINYAISELPSYSKENKYPYNVSVRVYAEKYGDSLKIIDTIKDAFAAASQPFKYDGTIEPQADVYDQYYTESNYQFKK